MVANAWAWADAKPGRKRVNPVHGEEEIRIVLQDTFEFLEEDAEEFSQTGTLELEAYMVQRAVQRGVNIYYIYIFLERTKSQGFMSYDCCIAALGPKNFAI